MEKITRPRLDIDTFISKMIALAHQRGNTLQSSLIKEYADSRCEGGYTDDLLRQLRIACIKDGCFIDDDLRLNESTEPVTVIIYGEKKIFNSIKEAIRYFEEGKTFCDPQSSEYERYSYIVDELRSGKTNVIGLYEEPLDESYSELQDKETYLVVDGNKIKQFKNLDKANKVAQDLGLKLYSCPSKIFGTSKSWKLIKDYTSSKLNESDIFDKRHREIIDNKNIISVDNLTATEQHTEISKMKKIADVIQLIKYASVWQGIEETQEHPKGAIVVTFDEDNWNVSELMEQVGIAAEFGYDSDTEKFDLVMERRNGYNHISKDFNANDLINIFNIKKELIPQLIQNVYSVEHATNKDLRFFEPSERLKRKKLIKKDSEVIEESVEVIPSDAVEKILFSLDSEISDSNIVSAQTVSDLVEDYLVQNDLSLELKDDLEAKVVDKLVASDILVTDEEIVKCSWCEEEYPKSDCQKEKDMGWLCDHCQRAIESRGTKLEFDDDPDGFYGINESVIRKPRLYSKTLAKVVDMCWHGNGRYTKYGKWSIGLGGYDLGYEVSYLVNGRFRGLFAIHPDNKVEMYQDEESTKALCGLNFEQIITSLQQVDRNITLGVDGEDF